MKKPMIKIVVIHGPNLNLLGIRETEVYGHLGLEDINSRMRTRAEELGLELQIVQSNHEGEIIEALHDARTWARGVVMNPAAYTHYSVAIRDAIMAVRLPVIEVHLSNIFSREEFRHNSVTGAVSHGVICGLGVMSYLLALDAIKYVVEDSRMQ